MGVVYESHADDAANSVLDGVRRGLALAGERLLALSVVEAPFELGTLIGSGAVSSPLSARDGDPEVDVTYDTPYAARLHEHPEYNFQNGKKGKYLEDPALQNREELRQIVETTARRG